MRANSQAMTLIHMEVGQPATPAPRAARERARQALENERLGYTEALGLPNLRERIARYMTERYGVAVRPERVVVTAGSSAGFVLAFLALLDQGDSLFGSSPTRSITGSNTRLRPRRRWPIPTRRSSSTASRNISA
jgi:aspartate/methionine/tyrosine aminotransferase